MRWQFARSSFCYLPARQPAQELLDNLSIYPTLRRSGVMLGGYLELLARPAALPHPMEGISAHTPRPTGLAI